MNIQGDLFTYRHPPELSVRKESRVEVVRLPAPQLVRTVHNFEECLAESHAQASNPLWEQIYRAAFPGFVNMTAYPQDGPHQRSGVDRSIQLDNAKQILIDEKWRKKDYGDILLEYTSNSKTKAHGWVCKPLLADYIAYAIATGKCYLLPVVQLQAAWTRNQSKWLPQYGTRSAQNEGYQTLNCPIPIQELYREIGNVLRVQFTPVGHTEARSHA